MYHNILYCQDIFLLYIVVIEIVLNGLSRLFSDGMFNLHKNYILPVMFKMEIALENYTCLKSVTPNRAKMKLRKY